MKSINLLPWREEKSARNYKNWGIFILKFLPILLFTLLLFSFFLKHRAKQIQLENKLLAEKITHQKEVNKTLKGNLEKAKQLTHQAKSNTYAMQTLSSLPKILPVDLILSEVMLTPSQLKIVGTYTSESEISTLQTLFAPQNPTIDLKRKSHQFTLKTPLIAP